MIKIVIVEGETKHSFLERLEKMIEFHSEIYTNVDISGYNVVCKEDGTFLYSCMLVFSN